MEELRRRVQADPTSIAFAALAEECRRAGQFEEAVEVCRTGLTRHPHYLSARVTLGRALVELNEFDEAKMELDQVLSIAPENLAAIRALADLEARRAAAERPKPPEAPAAAHVSAPFELDLIPPQPIRIAGSSAPPSPAPDASVDAAEPAAEPEVTALSRFLDAVVSLKSHSA